MREERRAGLRVVNGAAFQITADGNTHDHRTFCVAVRTPTRYGDLVADLMECRENIVEKLNLDDGLQAANSQADRAANNICLSQRRIENSRSAEFTLQICRHLKDAALALNGFEIL